MNVITYKSKKYNSIVFCCVDNINKYSSGWTKEIIKNISDYTISNVVSKGYDLLQGLDEDTLLNHAADQNYEYAVVYSTGTEFINGNAFFDEIESLSKKDFFVAGHILDRDDAFYELHHQCYVVNLTIYKKLKSPIIGKQELGIKHTQIVQWRSAENIHDDYTPVWISGGDDSRIYNHKCHGWNILKTAFDVDETVLVFDDNIRKNKKHYYPENQVEFLNHNSTIVAKYNFCSTQFIHTDSTEDIPVKGRKLTQILIPASGENYQSLITDDAEIIFYDYNPMALDYWKQRTNGKHKYVLIDFLGLDFDLEKLIDIKNNNTLINLSNIFSYEGTIAFNSLEYRIHKENNFIRLMKEQMPECFLSFSLRAATGFLDLPRYGKSSDFLETRLNQITTPTWHTNGDWNY